MNMMIYKIVTGVNADALESAINERLQQNWRLSGAAFFAIEDNTGLYCQPMTTVRNINKKQKLN